ncbi:MAG: 3'-5' exonuclease [Gammaproteobacteria bacterium]|nr:3'-5' exonuclease [Gammaproteobacteria bacterium]
MSIAVFTIKTIPDIDAGRRLYNLHDLSDKEIANVMFYKRRQETENSEFLRLHLHRVCSLSMSVRNDHGFQLLNLDGESETALLQQFYDTIDQHKPSLISWAGSRFDLPVLHYRSLNHGLRAPLHWSESEEAIAPDLQAMLTGFTEQADVPMSELATLQGLPGHMHIGADQVWDRYRRGGAEQIRHATDTEVLNTHLIYLRFQLFLGRLDEAQYQAECQMIRDSLSQQQQPHLHEYLSAWSA